MFKEKINPQPDERTGRRADAQQAMTEAGWPVELKINIYFENGKKRCEKRRKCWLPAFSPIPTMFSKPFSRSGLCGKELYLSFGTGLSLDCNDTDIQIYQKVFFA